MLSTFRELIDETGLEKMARYCRASASRVEGWRLRNNIPRSYWPHVTRRLGIPLVDLERFAINGRRGTRQPLSHAALMHGTRNDPPPSPAMRLTRAEADALYGADGSLRQEDIDVTVSHTLEPDRLPSASNGRYWKRYRQSDGSFRFPDVVRRNGRVVRIEGEITSLE